jgi:hypothetical protein
MMLQCATESDFIFYKQVGAAEFIFVLKFERFQKKHSYMEAKIAELDLNLKSLSKSKSTYFVSIGEDDNSSKVRSFDRGGRLKDPFFLDIFDVNAPRVNKEFQIRAGVLTWSKNQQEPSGFDVVKKRKAMETGAGENDAAALAAFEEFETSVLPALENIRLDEVVGMWLM